MSDALTVTGTGPLRGRIAMPGDKGISHRALLFSALARGRSRLVGLAGGDDVRRTRLAIEALGVETHDDDGALVVDGPGAAALREPTLVLDCANSGSSMRMLSGLLAGLPHFAVLTGDASLRSRPMRRVVEPLRQMGARIDGRDDGDRAPLAVRGGGLVGCVHELAVASAQVKTAIVLAGLHADGVTEVAEPEPSRDHTERMLTALGAPIERVDPRRIRVRAGAPAPIDARIPGDPSSAAFWVVAATIIPGSDVVIEHIGLNPTRIAFVEVLRRMGADITVEPRDEAVGEPVGDLHVRSAPLAGTVVAGAELPSVIDEVPILAIAAAFADGATEFRDAAELRVKESDRITTTSSLLRGFGVTVETETDAFVVTGGRPRAAGQVDSAGDHRIAMSAAVAGLGVPGRTVISHWSSIGSSYPEFTDHLRALGGTAE